MKCCYIDESGTGEEPYAIMAGIITDTYGMHITKNDWTFLLTALSNVLGKQITEIHTSDFYAGNGIWREIDGKVRARLINIIFNWLKNRNLKIVYTGIDKTKYFNDFKKEPYAKDIPSIWCFMALHICLELQKNHKSIKKYKGHTLVIFDNKKTDMDKFYQLFLNCPDWADTYYSREKKQEKFDQIIDVPYFADSKHVGLIQVADFVSFFLRRYVEIKMGIQTSYEDEPKRIEGWATIALQQAITSSAIYPKIGRCECADLFFRYAPSCII